MKHRVPLGLSLGLNALLGFLIWQVANWPRGIEPPVRPIRPSPEARTNGLPFEVVPAPPPAVREPEVPFHWSQIATTNFHLYRDRLRSVGCPEATVRDIIESEIEAWFAVQRRPLINALQPQFWEAMAKGTKGDYFDSFEKDFDALRDARRALLAEVLGSDSELREPTELAQARLEWQRTYAWLAPEQQAGMIKLEEQRRSRVRAYDQEVAGRETGPDDAARRRAIDADFETARKEILGEQQTEFALRSASEAHWADHLAGFEPNESEWRTVAQALHGTPDAERQAALQAALTPERFAEYTRASSDDYQQTLRVTRRLQLADETAAQAWEIQRAAREAAARAKAKAALDDARLQQSLQALRLEAERSLQETLGPDAFGVYRKHAGDWIEDLGGTP